MQPFPRFPVVDRQHVQMLLAELGCLVPEAERQYLGLVSDAECQTTTDEPKLVVKEAEK